MIRGVRTIRRNTSIGSGLPRLTTGRERTSTPACKHDGRRNPYHCCSSLRSRGIRGEPLETRVVLVDPQQMVRAGIRLVLEADPEIHVVAEAGAGDDALQLIERERPHVALLEFVLPRLSGCSVIERIAGTAATRFVILTSEHSHKRVQNVIRVGGAGYLLKSEPPDRLHQAIHAVRRGEYFFTPEVTRYVVEAAANPEAQHASELAALTPRECEVLQLLAEGLSTKEIASTLGIAPRTAETHRARMMDKLSIHKIPGLVRLAVREGLVEP